MGTDNNEVSWATTMSVPTTRGSAAKDLPFLNLPLLLPAGRLQGSRGFLPVLHHGQLLLAAGRGSLPAHAAGSLLLLRAEVLLGVHTHRLGYGTREGARLGKLTGRWEGATLACL